MYLTNYLEKMNFRGDFLSHLYIEKVDFYGATCRKKKGCFRWKHFSVAEVGAPRDKVCPLVHEMTVCETKSHIAWHNIYYALPNLLGASIVRQS